MATNRPIDQYPQEIMRGEEEEEIPKKEGLYVIDPERQTDYENEMHLRPGMQKSEVS